MLSWTVCFLNCFVIQKSIHKNEEHMELGFFWHYCHCDLHSSQSISDISPMNRFCRVWTCASQFL